MIVTFVIAKTMNILMISNIILTFLKFLSSSIGFGFFLFFLWHTSNTLVIFLFCFSFLLNAFNVSNAFFCLLLFHKLYSCSWILLLNEAHTG